MIVTGASGARRWTESVYVSDAPDSAVTVSVTVQNVGARAGTETVQLYLRDKAASVTRPIKELKGFKKVFLQAGEAQTVQFTITEDMLKFYNAESEYIAEAGVFEAYAGGDSDCAESVSFRLL